MKKVTLVIGANAKEITIQPHAQSAFKVRISKPKGWGNKALTSSKVTMPGQTEMKEANVKDVIEVMQLALSTQHALNVEAGFSSQVDLSS